MKSTARRKCATPPASMQLWRSRDGETIERAKVRPSVRYQKEELDRFLSLLLEMTATAYSGYPRLIASKPPR